jgi:hypothetical protein
MNKIVSDLAKLNLKEEEFDAISFFKTLNGDWRFLIVKYDKPQEYEKTEMGFKYYMFHTDKRLNNIPIVEEAILGDPLYVIKNFAKAGCEGVFAKKCVTSKEMLEKLVLGKDSGKRFEDFKEFVKKDGKEV